MHPIVSLRYLPATGLYSNYSGAFWTFKEPRIKHFLQNKVDAAAYALHGSINHMWVGRSSMAVTNIFSPTNRGMNQHGEVCSQVYATNKGNWVVLKEERVLM